MLCTTGLFFIDKASVYKHDEHIKPVAIVRSSGKSNDKMCLYLTNKKIKGAKHIIHLKENFSFEPLPVVDFNKRDVVLLMGKSGSGKSWWSKNYIKKYMLMHPTRKIRIVTPIPEDKTLQELQYFPNGKYNENVKYIPPDEKHWVTNKPSAKESYLYESLWLIDDSEAVENKKVRESIERFVAQVGNIGRKHSNSQGNITLLYVTHSLTLGQNTRLRTFLNECTKMVLYPQHIVPKGLKYLFENYISMPWEGKSSLHNLMKQGRHIMVSTTAPVYTISKRKAEIAIKI